MDAVPDGAGLLVMTGHVVTEIDTVEDVLQLPCGNDMYI